MEEHKIYLLKTHLKNEKGEYLYKIGRSQQQGLKRLKDYPNTYKLIIMRTCIDCVYIESELIKLFIKKYKKELKNEYFAGNEIEMVNDINKMINDEIIKSNMNINDNITTEIEQDDEEDSNYKESDEDEFKQKLDQLREKNRIRQKMFYERNKERIKMKKREIYNLYKNKTSN